MIGASTFRIRTLANEAPSDPMPPTGRDDRKASSQAAISSGRYEIVFSKGFKEGLASLPKEIYPDVDRALSELSADPYARNPHARPMKNAPRTYRLRLGINIRMLYRIDSRQRRVEAFGIAPRENVYDREFGGTRPLTQDETGKLLEELRGKATKKPTRPPRELPIAVEPVSWITQDELFLLHIPYAEWPAILKAGSVEALQKLPIEEASRFIVEDYWTNPASSQIDKLYTLGPEHGAAAIAGKPLGEFLIALDPEQEMALHRIRANGPYLLKGSAGTGKSLVGLYHIRDLVRARAGESMFDAAAATYGVITYTNSLVDANRALLESITPEEMHASIRSTTLDKVAYEIAARSLARAPNALDLDGIANWLVRFVIPDLRSDQAAVVERIGTEYVAAEIEHVIFANGLATFEEYVNVERRGRKRGLREVERQAVWAAFELFKRRCELRGVQTFEQWRLLALQHLQNDPDYPRFGALFVDEAQDLTRTARKLCLALVRDPKNLLMAADTGQSIYAVPPSWRQTDPRFDFRRRRPITLGRSYRATREIGLAIAPLRVDPGDEDDSCGNAVPVFSGPRPRWIEAPIANHAAIVRDEITGLVTGKNPTNPGQIGVIVRDGHQAQTVKKVLESAGISAAPIGKGAALRIHGRHVHILTAHSSKGLGFPIVFVPYVHSASYPWHIEIRKTKDADQRSQVEENEQRLLYVALSRASHRLCMLSDPDNPSPFVTKLNRESHWR